MLYSPAIILRPDIVAPFARVVESETDLGSGQSCGLLVDKDTYTPQGGEQCDEVNATVRQPSCASPDGDVNDIEVGQNAPHAVDLGVVPIDLRDDEKDETEGDGSAEA